MHACTWRSPPLSPLIRSCGAVVAVASVRAAVCGGYPSSFGAAAWGAAACAWGVRPPPPAAGPSFGGLEARPGAWPWQQAGGGGGTQQQGPSWQAGGGPASGLGGGASEAQVLAEAAALLCAVLQVGGRLNREFKSN